jgi:ABC-type multidrug transport system ATPase subunit
MIKSITITNYRSVADFTLDIEEVSGRKCFIFLGKNEAGKSNILKAVSKLNPIYPTDYELDCNKKAKRDKQDITVECAIDIQTLENFRPEFKSLSLPKSLLRDIRFSQINVIFRCTMDSNFLALHVYSEGYDHLDYVYDIVNERFIDAAQTGISKDMLTEANLKANYAGSYTLATNIEIEKVFEKKYKDVILAIMPECIFWENTNSHLINQPIDLNFFKDDFTLSLTLWNIFKLSGVENIKNRIELITSDYEERAQLKQELSTGITNHINSIWPEHEVNVRIEIEGSVCTVMVEDKDDTMPKYRMEQRSDGFKQFISILLNLSAQKENPKIIIMDEPEVHLHPSGIKYLRDELLRISETNIVLISTHSTYMVDKLNIDRHFKVFKEKSLTYIKRLDKDNPYEEEVIYEALGTSIFEHIQPNMILFEGKTDKDIFDAFTTKFKTDIKPLNIGTISTDGVEKIPQYLKFIDNKFVKGFVVVDSDHEGKKIKNQILKENILTRAYEINDLLYCKEGATLEDMIPKDLISEILNRDYNVVLTLSDLPYMKQINDKNKELNGKINLKDCKGALTNAVLNDLQKLTKQNIKEKYQFLYEYVSSIHTKIKAEIE